MSKYKFHCLVLKCRNNVLYYKLIHDLQINFFLFYSFLCLFFTPSILLRMVIFFPRFLVRSAWSLLINEASVWVSGGREFGDLMSLFIPSDHISLPVLFPNYFDMLIIKMAFENRFHIEKTFDIPWRMGYSKKFKNFEYIESIQKKKEIKKYIFVCLYVVIR